MDAVTWESSAPPTAGPAHLLVHLDVDADTLLRLALQEAVETPFGILCSRAAELRSAKRSTTSVRAHLQLRGQPPVENHDGLGVSMSNVSADRLDRPCTVRQSRGLAEVVTTTPPHVRTLSALSIISDSAQK